MSIRTIDEALLVHLIVEDHAAQTEQKFAQRCLEVRTAFRELFQLKEKRALSDAGPLAAGDPSIIVRGEADMIATEAWAADFKSIIHRVSRVENIPGPFAKEVQPKQKKPKKSDQMPLVTAIIDDDEDERISGSVLVDDDD